MEGARRVTDMAEDFKAMREAGQQKRGSNRQQSLDLLRSQPGIEISVKNGGAHLIVECDGSVVDFWPGTGRWIFRRFGPLANTVADNGRGVFQMLKAMGYRGVQKSEKD
jgi:hypothetical protein